jgi:exopolysaccharide/PEP-CTERM locus tyrosine autokinase
MGKFSDAFDRHAKESLSIPERIPSGPSAAPRPPLLGSNGFDPRLVVLTAPGSMDAENFKVLRTQILFPKDGLKPRVIVVTSALPGEGKTFVAANLAAGIALGVDQHVLAVDCDFRRPNLHRMFGIENREGLHEFLTGEKSLPELLVPTRIEKLTLLAAGGATDKPSELLSSAKMKAFLEEVRNRYQDRYIIIDGTPIQVTSEASALVNYVDGVILVVMAQKSPRDAVVRSLESLGREKTLGVVFNGYSQSYKSYHKYYKKYYK